MLKSDACVLHSGGQVVLEQIVLRNRFIDKFD